MVGYRKRINFWTAVTLETTSAYEFSDTSGFLNLCKTLYEKQDSTALMWVEREPEIIRGWNDVYVRYSQRVLIPNLSNYDTQILEDFGYPCMYLNISRRVRKQLYKRLIL